MQKRIINAPSKTVLSASQGSEGSIWPNQAKKILDHMAPRKKSNWTNGKLIIGTENVGDNYIR